MKNSFQSVLECINEGVSYCISRMYEVCILVDAVVAHCAISLCFLALPSKARILCLDS
jgi:hypothetical protein